jgi:prepilin-type N-terminal cleavage/methylation domain-containing protein
MFSCKNSQKGLSIIELLIAIAIFSMAFIGLFGVLSSSMAVIAKNKARLGAMALVEEQIEYVRSLPFNNVGTVSGNPAGAIPQNETISLNGISYNRRNAIFWIDDPADGTALLETDTISTDYKRIKVEVSWNFKGVVSSYSASSNVTPKGLETNVPGGIFNLTVFDYLNNNVQGARIDIVSGSWHQERYSGANGKWFEYGVPPGVSYEITVSKPGYSTSSTYSVSASLPSPDPGHLPSIDDAVNPLSFQIDRLSSKELVLYDTPINEEWTDTFTDESKLLALSSTTVSGSDLLLTDDGFGNYDALGTARSVAIAPTNLYQWTQFSWNDTVPANTGLLYRVYYDATNLIPDADLPGNSVGFTASPIDLSGLNTAPYGTAGYANLSIGVTATTNDSLVTPSVQIWKVSYKRHIPKGNFTFRMRGAKTIGQDAVGDPVYKYDKNLTTESSGYLLIDPLEWDTYDITASGFDVSQSCPSQPILITPNTLATVFIDFTSDSANSLLVRVVNNVGVEQPDALVRLYRASPAYDNQKFVGKRCAQVFWPGLLEGIDADGTAYSIDASIPPHNSTTTTPIIDVSGDSKVTVILN